MKGSIRHWLMAAALAAAFISPALADDGDVNDHFMSFGPRAAYFSPKDGDDVWFGGAQTRFYFGRFALEGSIDYRENDFGDTTIKTYPVQASLLAYLIDKRPLALFVLGGGGWYFTRAEFAGGNHDTDQDFGPHVGAGVQWFLDKGLSLDATYRYIWLNEQSFNDSDPSVVDRDYDASGSMVTIGLNFHFL